MNPQAWFAAGTFCLGSLALWWQGYLVRPQQAVALTVSQTGRDQAILGLIQQARTSVYLRTESLTLVPAGNELVQALQRNVAVTVDLPLKAGFNAENSRLPRLLMAQGAVVTFRGDPALDDRGTFLIMDGGRFLYSGSPLTLSVPGARVAYVAGPFGR